VRGYSPAIDGLSAAGDGGGREDVARRRHHGVATVPGGVLGLQRQGQGLPDSSDLISSVP
jgi:hypothetical protein